MSIARTLKATILSLCCSLTGLAQPSLIPAPGKDQIRLKGWETLHYRPSAPNGSTIEKPTGPRQRLIRTELQDGQPPNPMITTGKMVYSYSGYRGSVTGTHGLAPFSAYDTSYSLLNGSYIYQRLHPSGSLKYYFSYNDMSASSGPGATQKIAYEYDTQNRLLLDSFAQTGQPGSNLDHKNRYAYDNQDRLIYSEYAFNVNVPGGTVYRLASWKFYNGADTLPERDSVLLLDINVTTIKIVKHYYNSAQQLVADSAYLAGVITLGPLEVTHYTYLTGGKRVGTLSKWVNNLWSPYERIEQSHDDQGRETFLQFEYFENGIWERDVRRERQYTYDTQTELIPTIETHYNDFNGTWTPFSKDVRTFRDDRYVDTLYSYVSNTGHIDGNTIPSFFAYQYNDYGNLTQSYKHYFLENGQEISGYLVNYIYEEYNDPTGIAHPSKGTLALKAYPNPAQSLLHLAAAGTSAPLLLQITDISGVCHIQKRISNTETDIDIQQLAPGMYFISAVDERSGQYGILRFVKQ